MNLKRKSLEEISKEVNEIESLLGICTQKLNQLKSQYETLSLKKGFLKRKVKLIRIDLDGLNSSLKVVESKIENL